jgi:hypothetical protein
MHRRHDPRGGLIHSEKRSVCQHSQKLKSVIGEIVAKFDPFILGIAKLGNSEQRLLIKSRKERVYHLMAYSKKQSRRSFLLGSAALAPTITVGRSLAQEKPANPGELSQSAPAPAMLATAEYKPGHFTADEWRFINAACDRLIPKDDIGPGAVELGVPQYIDRQLQTTYGDGGIWYMEGPFVEAAAEFGYQSKLTPKQQYRLGIRAIDAHCRQSFNKAFVAEGLDKLGWHWWPGTNATPSRWRRPWLRRARSA